MTEKEIKQKYQKSYHLPPKMTYDWVKKECITKAPIWCSVDLRDGNQALIDPMDLESKLEFFKILVDVGFKEIEVGFPASSDTEYNFIRALIERDMIPDDVTIQVLTQAREHIIKKTFEAVKGAPHAVVHLYNSTSVEQREQVFKKSKEEITKIAVDGAKLLKKLADETDGNFTFEYSPESFSQPRWILRWTYVMPCWTYGSRPRSARRSSTFPPRFRWQCRTYLPARLNTCIRT